MRVVALDDTQQSLYSQFVTAHKSGSFLQSWIWGEFQKQQGKLPYRYGVFDGKNNLIATAQFLETKVPHLGGRYLYCAYGPLVSKDAGESKNLLTELITKLKTDFPNIWFIRLEPKDDLPINGKSSIHIQPGSTFVTDLNLSDKELLSLMHQKTRYNIKVAEKHSVSIETNPQDTKQAIALLVETSNRQGYRSHPAAYYEGLLKFLGRETTLYSANYQGKCIASAIMVDHGKTRTYLFGGSDNKFRNVMAPYALHWQAIQDAKQAGLTSYDWWGIETASGTTPGFVEFKLKWGGEKISYPEAQDFIIKHQWYMAYKILRKINRWF